MPPRAPQTGEHVAVRPDMDIGQFDDGPLGYRDAPATCRLALACLGGAWRGACLRPSGSVVASGLVTPAGARRHFEEEIRIGGVAHQA